MKSCTSIATLAYLLLELLNLAVGGPISENVADALIVERTGQHYGSYDWEFELFREDNCGQKYNGSVIYHGYGSKACAAEGGALGFFSVKVSRVASGCEVVFYDQPTCTHITAGAADSKVPKLDEHTLINSCLDRGLPTRGFEIKCSAAALAKRLAPGGPAPGTDKPRTYRVDFNAYWPVDCSVNPPVDLEYTIQSSTSTGCTHLTGAVLNSFKMNHIEDGCSIVLSDELSCAPNAAGPDPKLDVIDQGTKPATCINRQNPAKAYTIKCNDKKKRKSPWEVSTGPGAGASNPSGTTDWSVELFSSKDCNANNGGFQAYRGNGGKTCTGEFLGFDAVKIYNLTPGCSVDFFSDDKCPQPSLVSIGTRPNPPINVCLATNNRGHGLQVTCGGTPTSPPTKRGKVPLPGCQGPPPTPMVDAPDKYAFDLYEDQSCIPSTISSPGHYQQHFNGPGDTIDCQQYGATGNGFRGITINSIADSCTVTFYSDNGCINPVNNLHANDPTNSCRQFADAPGHDLQSIRSFVVRGCHFP